MLHCACIKCVLTSGIQRCGCVAHLTQTCPPLVSSILIRSGIDEAGSTIAERGALYATAILLQPPVYPFNGSSAPAQAIPGRLRVLPIPAEQMIVTYVDPLYGLHNQR